MSESAVLLEEVRTLIKDREEPFNILIVGGIGVGKSSLINSSHMAVAKKWNEFAFFGGGGGRGGESNTIFSSPFTMFKPKFMTNPIDGYRETIKMWDFAGMQNLSEDIYIKLIGLVLEGRIPENTSLIPILSEPSLTPRKLERKFRKTVQERRFHRVIMVCEANRDVPENLVQTVRSAAKTPEGRQIPIFVVFSKMDTTDPDSPAYKQRREETLNAFQIQGNEERFFETGLYSDRNTNCSREPDRRFKKNDDIDNTLLAMWRVLLNPAYDEGLFHVGDSGSCTIF